MDKQVVEQLKKLNQNFTMLNSMMGVILKFALDSSSYKSKTTNEISASSYQENEILRAMHEGNQ